MEMNENKIASVNNSGDNLAKISGIGPKYVDYLYQIGIRRFVDLTHYTPETLYEAIVKQAKRNKTEVKISPARIESKNWIGQARELAEAAKQEPTLPEPEPTTADKPDETWHEHAYFHLEFSYMMDEAGQKTWRTHIYGEPNADDNVTYHGIVEPAKWMTWILKRAKLPDAATLLPTESEVDMPIKTETRISSTPVTRKETRIKIFDVQLSEAESVPDVTEKQLMSQIRFQVLGEKAETAAGDNYTLRTEIHTVNLKSDAANLVSAEDDQFQPLTYTKTQRFPIPEVGHYELQSEVVLELPEGRVSAIYKGPRFTVKL